MKNFINSVASFLCDCVDNMSVKFVVDKIVRCLFWLYDIPRWFKFYKSYRSYIIFFCIILTPVFLWMYFAKPNLEMCLSDNLSSEPGRYIYRVTIKNNSFRDVFISAADFRVYYTKIGGEDYVTHSLRTSAYTFDNFSEENLEDFRFDNAVKPKKARTLFLVYEMPFTYREVKWLGYCNLNKRYNIKYSRVGYMTWAEYTDEYEDDGL